MLKPKGLNAHIVALLWGDFLVGSFTTLVVLMAAGLVRQRPIALNAAAFAGCSTVAAAYFQNLYEIDTPKFTARVIVSAYATALIAAIPVLLFLPQSFGPQRDWTLAGLYTASMAVAIAIWRQLAEYYAPRLARNSVLALGFSEALPMLAREVEKRRHLGYRFIGCALPEALGHRVKHREAPWPIFVSDSVEQLVDRVAPGIMVVLNDDLWTPSLPVTMKGGARGPRLLSFDSFYELLTGKLPVPAIESRRQFCELVSSTSTAGIIIKRMIDLAAVLTVGLFAAPIALVTALAIRLESEGPILYRQERVGLGGERFEVIKFRSMKHDAEKDCGAIWAQKGDPRVTRLGRIIRKLRIDEIPQLVNVLRGDMSMVGPRPERPEIVGRLAREIPFYDYRHMVKPGLTGWAQVCYPYGASVEDARQKLCYDLYYIKNRSVAFDFQILTQTSKVVVFGRGAQ